MQGWQDGTNAWLAKNLILGNTVNLNGRCRDRSARVHQLVKTLVPQQVAVDDAHGSQLDDLIARSRVQTGGFGVEHRIGQFGEQPVVQRAGRLGDLKQVKIVKL